MWIQRRVVPPNSLLSIIHLQPGIIVPDYEDRKLVTATSSCIMFGTLCDLDGETLVTSPTVRRRTA
jgi:hypothetical protein